MSKQTSSNGIGFFGTLALYAFLAAMYYLWQIEGMEQAGRVFIFYVWAMAVFSSLLAFFTPSAKSHKPNRKALKAISRLLTLLVLLATIWAGHIVAAVAFAAGWFFAYVHFTKAREAWEAAQ